MTEHLDEYAQGSGQDPAEVKRSIQETYKEIFPIIDQVSVAGDAINLFKKWEREYNRVGQRSILDALTVFNDLKLISEQGYESTLLLLDYASRHGVIELDCSEYVSDSESSSVDEKGSATNEKSTEEILYDRLLLAVYTEELFLEFGCFSSEVVTKESADTLLEISTRLSDCSFDELLDEAGIDSSDHSDESLLDAIEEYIHKFRIADDWSFNLENINNFIKVYVMLFVSGAVDAEICLPDQWHKLAKNIWENLFHRLGGEDNFHALLALSSNDEEQLLKNFIESFADTSSHQVWESHIQDSYLNLKKSVLLRTQINAFPEDGSEWLIHDRQGSNAMYFSDLLNKRVLDLWRLISWCDSFEQPIQYLRSEGGGYVCASWCHPDVDPTGDRGKESCYYFISDEGIAVVREFNEYLNLANERALNGAAMTIIQDVMGEYDMESVSTAFYQQTLHKAKSDYGRRKSLLRRVLDFLKRVKNKVLNTMRAVLMLK
jgi:hypothetical protein